MTIKLIKALKNRLMFVITIALFYPVLIDAFYKTSSDPTAATKNILIWGAIVSILLINYVILELAEIRAVWVLKTVNVLLLFEILAFIPVLFMFSQGDKVIYFWTMIFYGADLLYLFFSPAIVTFLLLIDPVKDWFAYILDSIK
jgi:hypothetical protein